MKLVRYSKISALLLMILPWLSVPILGKDAVKRFLPAGIFISIIVHLFNSIAKKRKWWWWFESFSPKVTWVIPFTWGPFIIGSIWILKYTYGKFLSYMALNIIIDGLFIYLIEIIFQKFGIFTLVRLKKIQLFYVFMVDAVLLYVFQSVKENKGWKILK